VFTISPFRLALDRGLASRVGRGVSFDKGMDHLGRFKSDDWSAVGGYWDGLETVVLSDMYDSFPFALPVMS
jgi:hypothetical protein